MFYIEVGAADGMYIKQKYDTAEAMLHAIENSELATVMLHDLRDMFNEPLESLQPQEPTQP